MLNFLVMIENSPASTIALEVACGLKSGIQVLPVYIAPSADHDLVVGAGWAWKTWERENRKRARTDVEHLVAVQRQACENLKAPAVVSGRPVKAVTGCFFGGDHDLIVAGAPFRGMHPETLAQRFQAGIRHAVRDLPLWIVNRNQPIRSVTALTDGGDGAERALGFLNRMVSGLGARITLVGLSRAGEPVMARDALNLERGFAILREKGYRAEGFTLHTTGTDRLKTVLADTDLLVVPFSSPACYELFEGFGSEAASVLFYLEGEAGLPDGEL